MATHSYPEGKDPREVFPDHIAQNTKGKSRDPREDEAKQGPERPPDWVPPTDPPAGGTVDTDALILEQARLTAVRLQQEIEEQRYRLGRNRHRNPDLGDYLTIDDFPQRPHYVVGTPPQTPVLRPLRQALYDRIILRNAMTRTSAFTDSRFFDDHTVKTQADTNMTQSGQLGYPLEYDLMDVAVHPSGRGEEYKRKWDHFISESVVATWIFGCNTPWARYAISIMEERFPSLRNNDMRDFMETPGFPEILAAIAREVPLPRYINMTAPGRLTGQGATGRRIQSTESFRMDFDMSARPWPGPNFDFFAVMHGILYAQL
jgi:hypothetical protein